MSLEMQDQQAEVQHNVKDTAEVDNCNDASSDDDDDYDSVPQKYLNVRLLVTKLILSSLTTYSLFSNKRKSIL